MNGVAAGNAEGAAEVGYTQRPLFGLLLLALLLAQIATTLTLFDPDRSWRPLLDDRPIVNGRHPLHLYHGALGAQSWRERNFGSGYDPAFQAGYPKTPIFDAGSRPAELFLLIGGEHLHAYKLGLAVCCVLVPLVFAAAARLLALGPATSCFAAALGQLVWWAGPLQEMLTAGDLDWLLAGLALVLHAALLVRYHREGGLRVWISLLLTSAFGWFFHPVLAAGFALLLMPFYVLVAMRHETLWHLGLLFAWGGGVLLNHGWLGDWLRHCWLYRPIPFSPAESLSESVSEWWLIDVGGTHADRLLAAVILGGGLLGVLGLLLRGRSAAGMLFGATALVFPALSLGSSFWEPLQAVGAPKLFVLACCFAAVPCASAFADVFFWLRRLMPRPPLGILVGAAAVVVAAVFVRQDLVANFEHAANAKPLALGLTVEQQTLITTLRAATRSDARILWEERPEHPTPSWSALLPWHTQRSYLGGLAPDAGIEHMFARLTATMLAGRPLAEWSDAELDEFCRRYNVSYVVCWTAETAARFRAWSATESVVPVRDRGEGWLLAVRRTPSFLLKGKARIIQMDARRIALADVEPEDGILLLSLHHQEGFRISPSTIRIERAPDPDDPIPFLRLRLPGPVMRLTLMWEN